MDFPKPVHFCLRLFRKAIEQFSLNFIRFVTPILAPKNYPELAFKHLLFTHIPRLYEPGTLSSHSSQPSCPILPSALFLIPPGIPYHGKCTDNSTHVSPLLLNERKTNMAESFPIW
uniref:Uncharacterized protein n=1 Tax=Cacopsylla melanoneura TaxID=428564 RepID=A0A8D9BTM7_9HEMI